MFTQTFQNFNINFNALNERNTVSSGDVLSGRISFDVTKETKITSIVLELKGGVHVHWSTGGGGGRKRRRTRRTHTAKLNFFKLNSVIVQENNAVGGATRLQPGTHTYPFTYLLPQGNFPSSFHGVHGQIVYKMTVGINRPWHMSKDFVTELNFVHRIDTNNPELRSPLSGSNKMTLCCLWCSSGPITLKASAEKKAFMPGETAKITCDVVNFSSQTATLKVKLQQNQTFRTHNNASTRMLHKSLMSVPGHAIVGEAVHTDIMLTIPPSAPPSITNCSLLQVDYMIDVTVKMWAGPDLTVLIPIILCGVPVNVPPQIISG